VSHSEITLLTPHHLYAPNSRTARIESWTTSSTPATDHLPATQHSLSQDSHRQPESGNWIVKISAPCLVESIEREGEGKSQSDNCSAAERVVQNQGRCVLEDRHYKRTHTACGHYNSTDTDTTDWQALQAGGHTLQASRHYRGTKTLQADGQYRRTQTLQTGRHYKRTDIHYKRADTTGGQRHYKRTDTTDGQALQAGGHTLQASGHYRGTQTLQTDGHRHYRRAGTTSGRTQTLQADTHTECRPENICEHRHYIRTDTTAEYRHCMQLRVLSADRIHNITTTVA
jgi:hypothetical protein